MKNRDAPKIIHVDRLGNAALVEFESEPKAVIYPASLLHAAKDLAVIMNEGDDGPGDEE